MDFDTLLVSEKEQKAYLPYKHRDLKKWLANSNYESIQEIIENEYILPLNRFKNAPVSRFRETMNLILNKEKKSIFNALDLAFELMFNYKLNPIIIAACRNLNDLDIYLDCLAENQLFDFKCFEIKFEVCPTK